jgi:tRNA(fMet)-specific endonuclease VapC
MLDTDICSYIMRERPQSLVMHMHQKVSEGHVLCISIITYQEMRFGAERLASQRHPDMIDRFCERLDNIASWTTREADQFALLQAQLFSKGTPIGHNDTMIATHALCLRATLVTNNQRHFSYIEGLALENWRDLQ